MRGTTVFLAPAGSAAGVRDVLTDMSAAGLVSEFYWLDDLGGNADAGRSRLVRVSDGVAYDSEFGDLLAGPAPPERIMLCVLIPSLPGDTAVSADRERIVSEHLDGHRPEMSKFTRVRVIIARRAAALPAGTAPAFAGWHNLVISPEDSYGPGLGRKSVHTDDPGEISRHATPVIAAVTGLWAAIGHFPLDDLDPLPGEALRVVRSFYRQLDGHRIEERLRERLFETGGAMPLPFDPIKSVVRVPNVELATHRMADELWIKRHNLLRSSRIQPPCEKEPKSIRGLELTRMFLAFLIAALKRAPGAWVRNFIDETAAGTARLVQQAILGHARSEYEVVVGGKTPDGRSVDWTAYRLAAHQIAAAISRWGGSSVVTRFPEQVANVNLAPVWRDYASAALTLLDAEDRTHGADLLGPIQVGADRGVVPRASEVVADPMAQFTVAPDAVAEKVETASLSPYDVFGIVELARRLNALMDDRELGEDAKRTDQAFTQWAGVVKRTYAFAFGERLTIELLRAREEVRSLLDKLNALAKPSDGAASVSRRERWVTRLALLALALLVLALPLAAIGMWRRGVSLIWIGVAGATAVVLTAVLLLIAFALAEREVFRLINRRREQVGLIDADVANLQAALRDVQVLSQAYGQYQSWSSVLGVFLADPLGRGLAATQRHPRIRWGLPRSTALGIAVPDEVRTERVAEDLRGGVLHVGWLSTPWERTWQSAGERLGPLGNDIRRQPELILSKEGAGSESALDVWSRCIRPDDFETPGASALWEEAVQRMTASDRTQLVDAVEYVREDAGHRISVGDFRAGVGDRELARTGHIDTSLFAEGALVGHRNRVGAHRVDIADHRLGWIAVTTQFSDGVSFDDLNLTVAAPPIDRDETNHDHHQQQYLKF
ncbi:hypothetical protein [Rhodococcus koreensis]